MIHKPLEQIWLSLKDPNKDLFGNSSKNDPNKHSIHPKLGYRIRLGDIVRFGRVRFFVK